MSLFILYRMFRSVRLLIARSRSKHDAESGNPNDIKSSEPSKRTSPDARVQPPQSRSVWFAVMAVVALVVVTRVLTRPRAQ